MCLPHLFRKHSVNLAKIWFCSMPSCLHTRQKCQENRRTRRPFYCIRKHWSQCMNAFITVNVFSHWPSQRQIKPRNRALTEVTAKKSVVRTFWRISITDAFDSSCSDIGNFAIRHAMNNPYTDLKLLQVKELQLNYDHNKRFKIIIQFWGAKTKF